MISIGVINLSPIKHKVFSEAARVLRRAGGLRSPTSSAARRSGSARGANVELWAACIAGAIPRKNYVEALEGAGFRVDELRVNDYEFISDRALDACSTYGVESISLAASRI